MQATKRGESSVQLRAEGNIRAQLEQELGIKFGSSPDALAGLKLDGYCDSDRPVCVEIWAHQGTAKPAQQAKIMKDMCKLLLAEKRLARQCRKMFVVADKAAVSHLEGSWQGEFSRKFDIEIRVVAIDEATKKEIRLAQKRQAR